MLLQVVTAEQALPQLRQQGVDAAAQLQPAQAQERQQGQCFAQQAPKLLQVAAALLGPVQECEVAAQKALPGVAAMQEALQDVLGQIEVCTSKHQSAFAVSLCVSWSTVSSPATMSSNMFASPCIRKLLILALKGTSFRNCRASESSAAFPQHDVCHAVVHQSKLPT